MASNSTPASGKRRRRQKRFKNQPTSVLATAPEDEDASLPKLLGVVQFAEARAQELESMASAVRGLTGTRRAFQTLPRHMRRRAMSHNSKRLPVRLRLAAEKEYEKQELNRTSTGDRKSRRHRRRPSNLRSEFARRQRNVSWLETHLWHSKRMHMGLHWGYRLAESPCEKGVRASYRSMSNGCLMSDISYVGCMELRGNRQAVLDIVSQLTRPQTGPTFAGAQCANGGFEGEVVLYRRGTAGNEPLGPASFLWRRRKGHEQTEAGPAAKRKCDADQRVVDGADAESTLDDRLWLWVHCAVWQEVWEELESAISTDGHGVALSSLRDELARFRLCGDASCQVLQAALHCAGVDSLQEERCPDEWWSASADWQQDAEGAAAAWSQLTDCSNVPPRAVLGLVVHDPRLNLPHHRANVTEVVAERKRPSDSSSRCWIEHASSPLWNEAVRQSVASTKISDHTLNEWRGKARSSPTLESRHLSSSLVPIFLCHRATDDGLFAPGWDVILPRSWAMPFWISLVYNGASAGGLRELGRVAMEAGSLQFPEDWPDTAAGQQEDMRRRVADENAYLRRPPAKRLDYSLLCVHRPFFCDWSHIIHLWSSQSLENAAWSVLRDMRLLHRLSMLVNLANRQLRNGRKKSSAPAGLPESIDEHDWPSLSLLACRVRLQGRGFPDRCASISLPLAEDWEQLATSQERHEFIEATPDPKSVIDVPAAGDVKGTLRCSSASPSRRLMGFVVRGGYSYRRGCGFATSFCSLHAVLHWLRAIFQEPGRQPVVLTRNNNSNKYHVAELSIITDVC